MKKSFVVRVDEEMFKLLEKWAHDEFRSVNGQMEYIIQQALVQAGRKKKETLADEDKQKKKGDV